MNPKPRQRYTAEFKAQAVELISTGKPVSQIAEELCIGSNLRSLRRENALLKLENDILKKSRGHPRHQTPAQLREMFGNLHQATGHGIRRICAILDAPRSSYYHAAEPTPRQSSDEEIGLEIEVIFKRHRRRYGYRRIMDQLSDQGITCAPARVRRIMLERGLKAIQPKTYVPRTSDGRADKPSPNLLLGEPLPAKPNQVWAGDITFIPTAAGWIYLAVVIDLCSRKIVGWALANHLRTELVSTALNQALGSRAVPPDLIFHSDRGSQYGSGAYRQILSQAGMRQSMSARANPYHNAWTESFMGTLKNEMLQDGCFLDEADARTEIFDYINSYYNNHRKHSALGYQTPAQFEAKIHSLN